MLENDLLPGTRRTLLHRIATAQVEGRAPSLVGGVVRDGAPVWTHGCGLVNGQPPTADTQYRIGSLTKTFVAVLVMRLRDRGSLDLSDTLGTHLPDGPPVAADLTVAQLLAHIAGLASEPPAPWWERTDGSVRPELADILEADPVKFPVGRRFHYSDIGFALLGALVTQLHSKPLEQVLTEEILTPLGMTRTSLLPQAPHAHGWAVHPWADVLLPEPATNTGHLAPAGQLWSTVHDLCRFATFLAAGNPAVLSAASLEEMRTPSSPPDGPGWDQGYGLGMQLKRDNGRWLSGHTGSMPGFVCALWVSPDDRLGGVAMANSTSGISIGSLAAELVRITAEHEPRIPAAWAPLPDYDPAMLELTGPWYWGPAAFALRLYADGDLELGPLSGTGRRSKLKARTDGTWLGLEGFYAGETLRAVRDAAGAVTHLELASFVFTREPYGQDAVVPGGVDPRGWRSGPA